MKPARWTSHALQNLIDREIKREEADKTLDRPEVVITIYKTSQVNRYLRGVHR